jgi:hypothetical protein
MYLGRTTSQDGGRHPCMRTAVHSLRYKKPDHARPGSSTCASPHESSAVEKGGRVQASVAQAQYFLPAYHPCTSQSWHSLATASHQLPNLPHFYLCNDRRSTCDGDLTKCCCNCSFCLGVQVREQWDSLQRLKSPHAAQTVQSPQERMEGITLQSKCLERRQHGVFTTMHAPENNATATRHQAVLMRHFSLAPGMCLVL